MTMGLLQNRERERGGRGREKGGREREGGRERGGRERERCAYFSFYNTKEYDYVFDIDIDDGGQQMRKLKLPYNKSGKYMYTYMYSCVHVHH